MKKLAMMLVLVAFSVAILSSPAIAGKDPPGRGKTHLYAPDPPTTEGDDSGWAEPDSPPSDVIHPAYRSVFSVAILKWVIALIDVDFNKTPTTRKYDAQDGGASTGASPITVRR